MEASIDQNDPLDDTSPACLHRFDSRRSPAVGKGGRLGASAFGGTTSQTAFGARSAATLLTKGTTLCAVIFMVTSLGLAILFTQGTESTVMEDVPVTGATPESAVPESQTPSETPPAEAAPEGQQ